MVRNLRRFKFEAFADLRREFLAACAIRKPRSLREFAESEIILPASSPFAGRRFRCEFQPFTRLFFEAFDTGRYNRIVIVGPTQTGKTLLWVIVILYTLFELRRTVVVGIPDQNMIADKWRDDLLPIVEASFPGELPTSGPGSKGGDLKARIQFRSGPVLRFMTGGGGDAARSHFSAKTLAITEANKLDVSGGTSREADKITQLEARVSAHGDAAFVILESNPDIEDGRVWREYCGGTESRIACPCPHCEAYVTPEREHLVGWSEAETDEAARRASRYVCPECGAEISQAERRTANERALLLHKGQRVEAGDVLGDHPDTRCLGFRWNVFNSMFTDAAFEGAGEWRASQDADAENAIKGRLQFRWGRPYKRDADELARVSHVDVIRRCVLVERGVVPVTSKRIAAFCDLGKWVCHWSAVSFDSDGSPHVLDYGVIETATGEIGLDAALTSAIREFRDLCLAGWPIETSGAIARPNVALVDSGWRPDRVYPLASQWQGAKDVPTYASKGFGVAQSGRKYSAPTKRSPTTLAIGDGWHVERLPAERVFLVEYDADRWKSALYDSLLIPLGTPGALTLYSAAPREHTPFARQLVAERLVEEYVAGRGLVRRWENTARRANHWGDATAGALCGGNIVGVRAGRIEETRRQGESRGDSVAPIEGRGGRAFVASQR